MTNDVIDSIMGYDPSNLTVFQETSKPTVNPNIYKTNPKDSKSEDGNYRATLRLVYNPYSPNDSIVSQTMYAMRDSKGFFMANALPYNQGGKDSCPLFNAWKTVFFANSDFAARFAEVNYPGEGNAAKREKLLAEFNAVGGYGKEANEARFGKRTISGIQGGTELGREIRQYADKNFDRTESTWVLVQIIEDANKPELVGQFKVMKLPTTILTVLQNKMHPSEEDKKAGAKPVDLMSWVLGPVLKMNVKPGPDDPKAPERKQREISYELCEFDTEFEPIHKIGGDPLFTDDQMEALEKFFTARNDANKAKTEAKRKAATALIAPGTELYAQVREMTGQAYKYLTEEAKVVDLVDECAYKPWDEPLAKRVQEWIDEVTLVNVGKETATTAEVEEAYNGEDPMTPSDEAESVEVPF